MTTRESAVAAALAGHHHEYERRISPSHYCSCGKWDGAFDWDGGPNDGQNDTDDAWITHATAAVLAALDTTPQPALGDDRQHIDHRSRGFDTDQWCPVCRAARTPQPLSLPTVGAALRKWVPASEALVEQVLAELAGAVVEDCCEFIDLCPQSSDVSCREQGRRRDAARAHQPTPPAQPEAVAAIERAESMRTQAVMAANWPLFHLMCEVLGDGDDSTTARAIADTAAAEAADTAARMRRTGGD